MGEQIDAAGKALWREGAARLAGRLARRELTARAAVEAHLARIEAAEPALSAFVTVAADAALARADALDASPRPVGPLHGVPVAVKDLTDTAGLRTTYGSALYADHVPAANDVAVARIEAAGGIVIGKTNTPEFGFGAVCQNRLAGPTRNPFDPVLTSGGSSGGSAVAVATGMAPLAHGTDFGGSVRVPASFCGVASIRPTPGLIPAPGRGLGWDTLATHGVLARDTADCALLLGAMAGADLDDPTSLFGDRDDGSESRLGATADFGAATVSEAVRARFDAAVERLERAAGPVARRHPDCSDAMATFRTLRAAQTRHAFGPLLARHGERLTDTVRWNIEAGAGITADAYLEAQAARTALYRRFVALFRDIDVLAAPACGVLPWPNADGEVTAIDGRPVETILDYLGVTAIVTLIGFPVLTLPVAPSLGEADGLPFGIQLIARPGEERRLVRLGLRLEREAGFVHRWPA
ncbi:amidase [Azospirillum agricola]|uniref:amidase n=1 Tax=Azospirillum agricola TaxID=1720247 RepID=UPI000A0F1209|nr:amidase [Azospirillum agricola]SMH48362.1 amidase [Azospirillum lipoferum]